MVDLRSQLQESSEKLKQAWVGLKTVSQHVLPIKCYEQWLKLGAYNQTLIGTIALFQMRDVAWQNVLCVINPANIKDFGNNIVTYNEMEIDFEIARHMSLVAYTTASWSIYDRVSNVCGRLAGVASLSENPKQNPKACEDFATKSNALGFTTHLVIQQAYAWPLRVTYKIRNWLVHEGYDEGGISLFNSNLIADGFTLDNKAMLYLESACGGKPGSVDLASCITSTEDLWPTHDLLKILPQYHAEVDTMFTGLLKWSVDSFLGQIAAFTARDRC